MTANVFMLDTDSVSYIVNGRYSSVRARFVETDPARICISVISRAELIFGLKRLPPEHRLHADVMQFFEGTAVLAWDEWAADIHADLRHRLRSVGRLIGEMDTTIAAQAIALDAVLVANNTCHFGRIAPPLRLENWATGPD